MCDQKCRSDQAQKEQLKKLFDRDWDRAWRKDERAQDPNLRTLSQMVQEVLKR